MFESSTSSTTVFEVAPSRGGGEIFWIYEIENPDDFFSDCETEEEASDRLIESDRSPDEQIETCGYTMVLENPEDPNRSVTPPDKPIIIEVIRGSGQNQQYEFYNVEKPASVFENAWGDTSEMYDSIVREGLEPMLEYDNVSLVFQRSYGEL